MARTDNLTNFLTDVADSIRAKKGTSGTILASNFDTEIAGISTGITPTGTLDITENGEYDVTDYASANVNIAGGSGKYAPRFVSFRGFSGTELDEEMANLDTSNMTTFEMMFAYCRSLKRLNLENFKTPNVTNMLDMFSYCNALTEINISSFNTSKITSLSYLFNSCSSALTINMGGLDLSKVSNTNSVFSGCTKLQNMTMGNNLGKGYTQQANYSYHSVILSGSSNLTHDSLMDIINKLYDLNLTYDVANGGTLYTQKLVLGATNLAKLTAEEIAIATNKGWTVS